MPSAQLDVDPDELASGLAAATPASPLHSPEAPRTEPAGAALKQEVADRLAAHRARRTHAGSNLHSAETTPAQPPLPRPSQSSRSAHIAAAVAERYAHSQTYRAFLAAEAERAVHQAEAAAQIATINAHAIAVAQQQLMADLEHWHTPIDMPVGPVAVPHVPLAPIDYAQLFPEPEPKPDREPGVVAHADLPPQLPISYTVRPYADAAHPVAASLPPAPRDTRAQDAGLEPDADEFYALEDEIAFRHNPVFDEISASEPIPANLIEFPRQLIAARKARPRLAEGPLRDDPSAAPQLRIFEVDADLLSPLPAAASVAPEWTSILLSALPPADFSSSPDLDYLSASVPQAAPIRLRLSAAAVDLGLILATEAAFFTIALLAFTHLSGQQLPLERVALDLPRIPTIAAAVVTLAIFAVLYQLLFFTLSDATPGMRHARIGLCTLTDENPTRSDLRRRILLTVLSAAPLGLGLLWAFLDEDTLGWHDRLSRMYQRAY